MPDIARRVYLAASLLAAVAGLAAGQDHPGKPPEPPTEKPAPAAKVEISILPATEISPVRGDDVRTRTIGFVKGLRYILPLNWTHEDPPNAMRLKQIKIPPLSNEANAPGTLTITGDIGGSVDDNIARWVAQFKDLEGVPTQQDLQFRKSPLLVTQVIATGTLNVGRPGGEPEWQPETTLYGAVVQGGPEGIIFIKAWGPKGTMKERRVAWDVFIRNLVIMAPPEDVRDRPRPPSPPPTENPKKE